MIMMDYTCISLSTLFVMINYDLYDLANYYVIILFQATKQPCAGHVR